MGVVYEAYDRERGHDVAIKVLERAEGEALYRFKTEFRALADISHRNLVTLYDLFVTPDGCYFTMELVEEGKNFVDYCRNGGTGGEERPSGTESSWEEETAKLETPADAAPPCDEQRLRVALPQLVAGLSALHTAGWLHRDVKASNVLVDRRGRVVLLDFGLATDATSTTLDTPAGHMVGTIEYVAPEQAFPSRALTPAADWYSAGAILYEVLTGRLPFEGSVERILSDKQSSDPAPPHVLVPSVPNDLDRVCTALLSRDPVLRPDASTILSTIGAEQVPGTRSGAIRVRAGEVLPFAGRTAELDALGDALAAVTPGHPVTVVVHGPSGIGKTELVREFVARAGRRRRDLVALLGRCYQSEAVPYRSIDPVVDNLSRIWSELDDTEAMALVPDSPASLVRLFPVLARIPVLVGARDRLAVVDPQELRRRGARALAETLARLGERHPLVVFLDDLQWVDRDTMHLLRDLISGSDAPPLLLILAGRDDLRDRDGRGLDRAVADLGVPTRDIKLGPLANSEAVDLAARALATRGELAAQIARESAGVPLFAVELAAHARAASIDDVAQITLNDVLATRIGNQTRPTRVVLELIAVAGEPLTLGTIARASNSDAATFHKAVQALQIGRLARTTGSRSQDLIEPYHDRIREAALAMMDAATARLRHSELARALERQDGVTAHQLARYWLGAGDPARATIYTLRAARAAFDRLDFDHAAELYRTALEIGDLPADEANKLQAVIGAALANAGRPQAAAIAFHQAAVDADAAERLDLERRAAEQLVRGGYLEEGLKSLIAVLSEMEVGYPRRRWLTILAVLLDRLRLRLRGLDFRHHDPSQIPAEALGKVDLYASVGASLSIVDPLVGIYFYQRGLRLALQLGERRRVARAMALQATFHAAEGNPRRTQQLITRACEVTGKDCFNEGYILLARASYAFFEQNAWQRCVDFIAPLEDAFHQAYASAGWEIDTAHTYASFARMYLGHIAEMCRVVDRHVADAEERSARYAATNFRVRLALRWLVRGDPDRAQHDVDTAIAEWPSLAGTPFQVQHFYATHSWCEIALYRDQPEVAARRLQEAKAGLRSSLLLRVPQVATEVHFLEGRIALARAARGEAEQLRRIARARRRLARQKIPLASPLTRLLDAGAAHLAGRTERAAELLEQAVGELDAIDTGLYSVAARWRHGQLLGGEAGDELTRAAAEQLTAEGVHDPDRLVQMLFPGWPSP